MKFISLILAWMSLFLTAGDQAHPPTNAKDFKAFWYQGKAELNRYSLKQARYGELHEGDAVFIFVTEDFLQKEQVKRDSGNQPYDSVLKLNFTKKFHTGIYPYSVMTSAFTKIDFDQPETAKLSFSSQEWCGHVYAQLNLKNHQYELQSHSYFQGEADQFFTLAKTRLEDEIWNIIRIAPHRLPTGSFHMIPSIEGDRFAHRKPQRHKAEASLQPGETPDFPNQNLYIYKLTYPKLERDLEIYFEKQSPFQILGWRETRYSGRGEGRHRLTTVAIRTKHLMTKYWNQNKKKDRHLRQALDLK